MKFLGNSFSFDHAVHHFVLAFLGSFSFGLWRWELGAGFGFGLRELEHA